MIDKFSGHANFMKVNHLDNGHAIKADEIDEFGGDHASLGAKPHAELLPEKLPGDPEPRDYPLLTAAEEIASPRQSP